MVPSHFCDTFLQGPLLDDPDLVGAGGIVVYGETALRLFGWVPLCKENSLLSISITLHFGLSGEKEISMGSPRYFLR